MHRLDVLGPPRLTRPDGSPADLALGKPFAVLVFLALTDTPPTRKELARLFWPASEASNARQSVRQTLSILRRALGPDLFGSDDPVKLTRGAIETDVDRLREAIAEGDADAAETLWRGRLMAEFALPDAPEWTRWVESREMALEAALVALLTTDAEVLRQRGDLEGAVARLEKAIEIDPYREGPHSALVELHLEAGRLTLATRSIGRAREALGPDAPAVDRMAESLERRVKQRELSESGRVRTAASELKTELVGRTREMSALLEAWRRSVGGEPHVIAVTGPAGIGKTRLTEELAQAVRLEGAEVVRVTAERSERSLEWGVVAELARKLADLPGAESVDDSAAATLKRLSPAIPFRGHGGAGTGDLEPTPVAGSLTALLLRVAHEKPTLVVVDEAQWADESSRAALSRLARSLDAAPCALVVCMQDEEIDGAGRDFLNALQRADPTLRLRLAPLSDADVREMIALMVDLPEQSAHVFRERLAEAAEGNPLYLTELLRALVEQGTLVAGEDGLRLATEQLPDPLPLPANVQELLRRRLAHLSDPAIAFAAHLARLGGKAGLEAVKEKAELTEGELARAAGELLEAGIVVWRDPEQVAFVHERLRRTVLDRFPVRTTEPSRSVQPWWVAAAAIALLAIVLGWSVIEFGGSVEEFAASGIEEGTDVAGPAGSAEAPARGSRGDGVLLSYTGDTVVYEIDTSADDPTEWRLRRARFWAPPDTERRGPFRLAGGDTVWYVPGLSPDAPPSVIEARSDGTRREIIRTDGDVNLPWVSPDGTRMTYVAQNTGADAYHQDLYVARPDGSDAKRILAFEGEMGDPTWSPGGAYISVVLVGSRDTLLAVTPSGERAASAVVDRTVRPAWCGTTDTLVSVVEIEGARSLLLLDVGTGETRRLEDPDALLSTVACSPDGRTVVYDRAVEGRAARVARDLESGNWVQIPVERRTGELAWLPRLETPASLLFRDRFETLDPEAWLIVGEPAPRAVDLEDGPALSLEGDGLYKDGIVSRREFDLRAGATLEFDFCLNPIMDHHQKLYASLVSAEPIPGQESAYPDGWRRHMSFGLEYPARDEIRFDPTEMALGASTGEPLFVYLPDLLPTEDWVTVGLRLRTDGLVELLVNGEHRATSRLRLPLEPDLRFRILILGAAVDTELYVRDVRLWEGVRG